MNKLSNFLKNIVAIAICFVFGVFVANACEIPEYAVQMGAGMVVLSMVPRLGPGVLAETIPSVNTPNVAGILATYFGKHERKLFSTLTQDLDIATSGQVIPGIKGALNLTKLTVKDGIKGYEEAFEPDADDLTYTPRKLEVELCKRDIRINPLKYRNTWMAEVMQKGVKPQDLPFAQYVFEQIRKQLRSEINRKSYLAVAGDRSVLETTVTGWGTIIANAITATDITPVATGAITNANAVSKVELVARDMPVEYQKAGFDIDISYDVWQKYQDDYRERYGKYIQRNKDGFYSVDAMGPDVRIEPRTWMGASQRVICTPNENKLIGVDALGDMDRLLPETKFEILELRVLFALGYQLRDLDAIRVNDVA